MSHVSLGSQSTWAVLSQTWPVVMPEYDLGHKARKIGESLAEVSSNQHLEE